MFWHKKQDKRENRWRTALVVTFAVTMVVNGLAGSTTLLGGATTAEISDSVPNLFAPAGFTFAIWGVIYLLLVGFILYTYGIGRRKKSSLSHEDRTMLVKVLTYNLIVNTLWMLMWQYRIFWFSVSLIVAILMFLAWALDILRDKPLTRLEYVLVKLPFSVYFGWITVAVVANVTTWLADLGWQGEPWSQGTLMVFVLIAAAVIGLVTALRNRDVAYLAVLVWAFAGILLKHLSPDGFNGAYPSTIITLTIGLAVFLSVGIQLVTRDRRS